MSHMSARARRAFDRVREQLRLSMTTLVVAGEVMREQRRAHERDRGLMAELVSQLLEAEETTEALRGSLARMTGRYAEALHELERLRAANEVRVAWDDEIDPDGSVLGECVVTR